MRIWSWQHVSAIHCWVEPSLLLSSLFATLAVLMRLVVLRTTYIFHLLDHIGTGSCHWLTEPQKHILDPVLCDTSCVCTMSTLLAQTRPLSTRCLQHVADYKKVQIHPPLTPPQWYRPLKYFEDPFTSQTTLWSTNWVFAGVVHQGRKKSDAMKILPMYLLMAGL